MKFRFLITIVTVFFTKVLFAQTDLAKFKEKETQLRPLAEKIIFANTFETRLEANTDFVKNLVKTLELSNSFQYPFDSLQTISIENAPDNKFRIFTWELQKDDNYFRQYGAIQMN
ncbi:MAG: hypothetical protein DI598_11865, partial [Pseudopedobacter saltans]